MPSTRNCCGVSVASRSAKSCFRGLPGFLRRQRGRRIGGRHEDLAVHDAADGVGEFGLRRFRNEAADPAIHRLGDDARILEAGDDDDRKAGIARADTQHAFEPFDRRHGEIDQREIEARPALDMRHRLFDRGCLDHFRLGIGGAHGAFERLAKKRMIVDDQKAVHRSFRPCHPEGRIPGRPHGRSPQGRRSD